MSKIAFIYPGQGAQAVGMGKDFYEKSPLSRTIFDQASEAVNLDLKKLCFEENDLLDKTEYTQVAMVTACLAMTRAVESMGLHADMTAGLSLGEYCAIAVAGGMCDLDAIHTVRSRGIFMEHAAPEGSGAMSAVLGMDASVIENVLNGREGVSIANYNCPGQLVISGSIPGIDAACEKMLAAGAKRALKLKVGGAFHSPLMEPARAELAAAIEATPIHKPSCPVYQNVSTKGETNPETIKANLIAQLTAPVRWTQSVQNMIADGADHFIELGPGAVLQGLVKKINKEMTTEGMQ